MLDVKHVRGGERGNSFKAVRAMLSVSLVKALRMHIGPKSSSGPIDGCKHGHVTRALAKRRNSTALAGRFCGPDDDDAFY
jgi:hypothetical protein